MRTKQRKKRVMPADEIERREKVTSRVRDLGYRSVQAACIDRKVDPMLIHRTMRDGLAANPHEGTVEALKRLGVLDLFRATA